MTLSRTPRAPRRIFDQRLTAAYRPIWSPGLFEVNLKSLQPPALETAVIIRNNTWITNLLVLFLMPGPIGLIVAWYLHFLCCVNSCVCHWISNPMGKHSIATQEGQILTSQFSNAVRYEHIQRIKIYKLAKICFMLYVKKCYMKKCHLCFFFL